MQCANCGNTLLPEDEFCPECGHEVKKHVEDKPLREEDESFRNTLSHDDVNDREKTESRAESSAQNAGPSAQEKLSQTMKNIQSSDFFKEAIDFLKVSVLQPASLVKSPSERSIKVPLIVIAALIFLVSLFTFISLRVGTSNLSEFYGSSVVPFSVFLKLFLVLIGAFAIYFVLLFIMNQFFLKERVSLVKLAHDYLALSVAVIGIWIFGLLCILVTLVEVGAFAFLLGVTVLMIIPLYMFMVHLRQENGKFDTFHMILVYSIMSVIAYLVIVRLLSGLLISSMF